MDAGPAIRRCALIGFALHAVSNNLDAAAHAALRRPTRCAGRSAAARRHGLPLETVNVGGGFGIDYTGAARFDLDVLADGLAEAARRAARRRAAGLRARARYLAADAGWYAAEVLDLKRNHGRWFAVLRGGTHHFRLPAAWGYSHPLHRAAGRRVGPAVRPARRSPTSPVDAVGELCTPRDVLTRDQPVTRLRVGDLLVFARTGAYGWDMSHHDFLRHDPPEFLVTG